MVYKLRDLGYLVTTSYDAGQASRGICDREVVNYATQNNFAVITFNRDHFIELHNSCLKHAEIIICKTDRDYRGQIQVVRERDSGILARSISAL